MSKDKIRLLQSLASEPLEQAALALEYLAELLAAPKRGRKLPDRELTQSILRVLSRTPEADSRSLLLDLYARYAANGVKLDPGGYLRTAILTALRPNIEQSDHELLSAAVKTYEFPPPEFKEETALLRGMALIALNELDDREARFHAARLLADEFTDPMSGEPALSAIRVLGTQGEILLLYYYAAQHETATLPEVLSEALRNLTDLPHALLAGLIERHGESKHDVVVAGLFDLLLQHDMPLEKRPNSREFISEFMRSTEQLDAYHYLISTAVAQLARGDESIWPDLKEHIAAVQNREKADILLSTLSILGHNREVAEHLQALEERILI